MEAYELAEEQMALFLTSLLVRVGSLLSTLMCHVLQHPHLLSPGKKLFEKESKRYILKFNVTFVLKFLSEPHL